MKSITQEQYDNEIIMCYVLQDYKKMYRRNIKILQNISLSNFLTDIVIRNKFIKASDIRW